MTFFRSLISSDDTRADSIIIAGLFLIAFFIGLAVWDVVVLRHDFQMFNFGSAAAVLLSGLGGAKGGRDWLSNLSAPTIAPEITTSSLPTANT